MLDTVLEIGKVLRAAPDGLRHHRYIRKAPVRDKKNPVIFWVVPTSIDGSFDFTRIELLTDEDRQRRLLYLNYKQSDADSTKPYIYGDLYRTVIKSGSSVAEDGNFRFGDPSKKSWMSINSFRRAEGLSVLPSERVKKFRASFGSQIDAIEEFIRAHPNVYIQFDFEGKAWHELDELKDLNQSLLETFFEPTRHGYVMRVFLYKTLATGPSRTPSFQTGCEYRNRVFKDADEALDLLYGVNYSSKPAVRKNDVKIVVLPRGENLTANQIETFFERTASTEPTDQTEVAEEDLRRASQRSNSYDDDLFAFLNDEDEQMQNILQFDFVFSKAGGTQPDIDMIELSGLERSKLTQISARIRSVRREVEAARSDFLLRWLNGPPKKAPAGLSVTRAFLSILGDSTRSKKKYQSHLFRVLPSIYTDSYCNDPVLLPALIERVEFNVRNNNPNFNFLKFEFYFLVRLQRKDGDYFMDLQHSPSYRIGILLGKLAKPFAGQSSPIKSFEKNYVGLLSRRVTTLSDVRRLANDINQKLVMHEKLYPDVRAAASELARQVSAFGDGYDRHECAFGFFESYFAPIPARAGTGKPSDPDSDRRAAGAATLDEVVQDSDQTDN